MSIPERAQKYKQGLIDMINWMDQFSPVRMMKIIEVGSWTGCSSEIFAKRFDKVICIDLWKSNIGGITNKYNMHDVEKIFDKRAEKYKGIICKSKMSSIEASKIYKNNKGECTSDILKILPEVLYIDAAHDFENVKNDLLAWKSIPTKFICGHDYEKRFMGVVKAVNKVMGKPQKIFKDSSWIIKLF